MDAQQKINDFFADAKALHYQTESTLYRAGDKITFVLLIISGYVGQKSTLPSGNEVTLSIFTTNAIIPLSNFMESKKCSHDLFALTHVIAKKAPAHKVLDFILANPDVLEDYFFRFSRALTQSLLRIESTAFGDAREKVSGVLYLMAKRFARRTGSTGEMHIDFPLSHKQIAQLIGMTRESVSSVMIALKKENSIYYTGGKVTVLDLDKLLRSSGLSHYEE